ncbi:MAG: hypothetical protein ABIV63_19300 [Caldimonas sp.]
MALACVVVACGGGSVGDAPSVGQRVGAIGDVTCPGVDASNLTLVIRASPGPYSIGVALWEAAALGWPIALRHGLYQTTETIELKKGVSLYGSCLFDGEPDRKYRTIIQASPAPGTPAILASDVNVTVSGVVVLGKDETANGAASVAMTAASANVTLRGTVLVAGNGGPGASRAPLNSPAAASVADGRCPTPGGAASDSLWGQVDLGHSRWVAGIGGAGGIGGTYTGPGGVGGQQGGASIGLLLVNSPVLTTVEQEYNRIIGGFGGVGGAGQAGSTFGHGRDPTGGGAGGNGGPSIGVASINSAGLPNTGGFYPFIYANAPGGPGAGGAAAVDGPCLADPGAPGVPGGSATVHQFPIPNTLMPGEWLAGGQSIYSPDLRFQLILRDDGDLCLTSAGNPLWCSQTKGTGIYQAILESDGRFCMYQTQGDLLQALCEGRPGPGSSVTVRNSGHAELVQGDQVQWSVP